MEVARGKRHRHAGPVGRDRGISGMSRADLSVPGPGGSRRQGSLRGLPRERDGRNGSRYRGQTHVVRLASVDYGAARATDPDLRAVAFEAARCSLLMPTAAAGPEIERLIQLLARLPGLGPRSARRAALFLIKKREQIMAPLAIAMQAALEKIEVCRVCGNIDSQNPCTVCTDVRRDPSIIVVVADVADLWALDRAHAVNARYHVLGGTLSPLDGVGPGDLTIDALVSRAHDPAVTEVILALNATVDGQTTAHYITDLLHDANVKVTRLAHGVPVGGELDYLDEGTLAAAIRQRTTF